MQTNKIPIVLPSLKKNLEAYLRGRLFSLKGKENQDKILSLV